MLTVQEGIVDGTDWERKKTGEMTRWSTSGAP